MAPNSASIPGESPNRSLPLFSTHFKISKWVAFTYCLAFFKWWFCTGPRVTDSAWEPFYLQLLYSLKFYGLLDITSTGFTFWWLVSPVQDTRVGVPDVCRNSLLLREKFHIFKIPPNCGSPCGSWGFLPLLPISVQPFYPMMWRCFSSIFQDFFGGNYSICSYKSIVAMGRGDFRIFLCQPSPQDFTEICWQSRSLLLIFTYNKSSKMRCKSEMLLPKESGNMKDMLIIW